MAVDGHQRLLVVVVTDFYSARSLGCVQVQGSGSGSLNDFLVLTSYPLRPS